MKLHKMIPLLVISLSCLSLGLDGCATGINNKIDAELAREPAIQTHSDLQTEADRLVTSAPGLTPQQRNQLLALKVDTRSRLDALYLESLKLRSLMLKRLITADYHDDEIQVIESRISKAETAQLSVMFSAVEQANAILGHQLINNRVLVESFFEGMGHGNRE